MSASSEAQLTLDGGEVPALDRRARLHLTDVQRELLRLGARPEGVGQQEAGMVVHRHRDPHRSLHVGCSCRRGVACKWAGNDGWEALKRLRKRGLIQKAPVRGAPYVTVGAVRDDDVAGPWRPAGRVLPYCETGVS